VEPDDAPSTAHALASLADGVVVVGASAGGVEALAAFVGGLALETPQAICVVLHVSPSSPSAMPDILGRATRMPVHRTRDGEPLLCGHVYVAPPDHHLEVERGRVRLTQAPRENGHRPAIDATMRSAAAAYGYGVVGVVLSGSRDDGTAGLAVIKQRGGSALVQDPEEALYPSMPASAIAHADVDAVLPLDEMGGWLATHRPQTPPPPGGARPTDDPRTPHVGKGPRDDAKGTRFTCPDCGGVLFEQDEGGLARFRCSVGHAFSIESMAAEQAKRIEGALWTAVRALEDRAELLERMAANAKHRGQRRSAPTFARQAAEVKERAALVREAAAPPESSPLAADADRAAS
jgi:two-component system, chemotaxis family, protein-glutamate methylesterase/glutaminase